MSENLSVSSKVQIFSRHEAAPNIPCVYVFEVEKGLIKCGMSQKAQNRRMQLYDIQKHRGVEMGGRFAILTVERPCLRRSELLLFKRLKNRIDGTEMFKMTFEAGVKALKSLCESADSKQLWRSDAEIEMDKKHEEACKELRDQLTSFLFGQPEERDKEYCKLRNISEGMNITHEFMRIVSLYKDGLAEQIDVMTFERLKREYDYLLKVTDMCIVPCIWPYDFAMEIGIPEKLALQISSLYTRLQFCVGVVSSYSRFNYSHFKKVLVGGVRTWFNQVEVFIGCLSEVYIFYKLHKDELNNNYYGGVSRGEFFKSVSDRALLLVKYILDRLELVEWSCLCKVNENVLLNKTKLREELRVKGRQIQEWVDEEKRII